MIKPNTERNGLLAVPLTDKLKGTGRVHKHILRTVKMTSSWINMAWWIQLLQRTVVVNTATKGPAFCDEEVFVWNSITIDEILHEALESIYTTKREPWTMSDSNMGCIGRSGVVPT